MSFLPTAQLSHMQTLSAAARAVDTHSISIRRGGATLDPQTVRIVRSGRSKARATDRKLLDEAQADVVIMGPIALDIEVGDRFNDGDGQLYEVTIVHPNRTVQTKAEGTLIQ